MSKSLTDQDNTSIVKTKSFELLHYFPGALLGLLIFTSILFLFWIRKSIFFFALLLPGNWAVNMLGLSSNVLSISDFAFDALTYSIAYLISCIPFAILGSLFGSKKMEIRVIGITLYVVYFIFSLFIGFVVYSVAMIG